MSATEPFEGKTVAGNGPHRLVPGKEDKMRTVPAVSRLLMIVLTAVTALAGCTAERAPDVRPGYSGSVSPAMRAHRRKQAIRAEEGGYRRLYRQKGCRYAARGCDGYGRFSR